MLGYGSGSSSNLLWVFNMKTVTLRVQEDDVDHVVVEDLQRYYHLLNQWDKIDLSNDYIEPDFKTLEAILVVLSDYMESLDFEEWSHKNPIQWSNPDES